MQPQTHHMAIDHMPAQDAMSAMLDSHIAALEAARSASAQIAKAADLVARTFQSGSAVHYAAAGSSGLMALADACELPGTFQIPQRQIRISMAGGVPADGHMPGNTEDSENDALRDAAPIAPRDLAIVVSASGTTPYALSFAREARQRGASIVAIANVANSTLLTNADIAIALNTAPEVVEGSTRLGAGTAQKVALNMISTQAGVLLGHVHDGLMVNLNPDNIKLRKRAASIVSRIANVSTDAAEDALRASDYNTKCATLIATGLSPQEARQSLERHSGHLNACLQGIERNPKIQP